MELIIISNILSHTAPEYYRPLCDEIIDLDLFSIGGVYKPRGQNFGQFWLPPPYVDTFTK